MTLHIHRVGTGPALVLFHGWGFDSRVFSPLIPTLSLHWQLFLVDMPGLGKSAVMDWSLFKEKLLIQLPQRFALLGWSMGGLYATRLALEEPARVSSICNITSSPYFLSSQNWPGVNRAVLQAFHKKLTRNATTTLVEFVSLQTAHHSFKEMMPDTMPSKSGLQLGLSILGQWDLREALHHISIPLAYIFGRLDSIVPAALIQSMQAQYPKGEYFLLSQAGHLPFVSHTEACLEILQGFLL